MGFEQAPRRFQVIEKILGVCERHSCCYADLQFDAGLTVDPVHMYDVNTQLPANQAAVFNIITSLPVGTPGVLRTSTSRTSFTSVSEVKLHSLIQHGSRSEGN